TLYLLLHKNSPAAESQPAPKPAQVAAAPPMERPHTATATAAAPASAVVPAVSPSLPSSSLPSSTAPAQPSSTAPAQPSSTTAAARLIEQAEVETRKQNFATAVGLLVKAKAAGAGEAQWRALDDKLERALQARVAWAHKRRNLVAERQARRELQRLRLSR